jgi:hypothetical protein
VAKFHFSPCAVFVHTHPIFVFPLIEFEISKKAGAHSRNFLAAAILITCSTQSREEGILRAKKLSIF